MSDKFRKLLSVAFSVFLICIMIISGTACGIGEREEVNEDAAVLNVINYDGGVGHAWLDAVIERFEAKHADAKYVEGKKGVDINVLNTKTVTFEGLNTSEYSVYFAQGVRFNELQAMGRLLNISDIVTEKAENGKSIESKMSEKLSDALKGYDGEYYVLPHYQSFDGVTYNKTVFDENNFYFAAEKTDYVSAKEGDPAYGFVKNADCKKTCGPDGEFDTEDDGLPSSVEEFKRLCEYMKAKSVTPFIYYGGNNGEAYRNKLINALWVSLEGYEGATAQFSFDSGESKSRIVTGFNGGKPVSELKTIKSENMADVYQQESKFYALDFFEYVFKNENNYHSASVNSVYSHTDIQKLFLKDGVGMLLEGTYWENEARSSGTFEIYKDLKNVETRCMPLPIQGTGSVAEGRGRKPVMIDTLNAYAFINANTQSKFGDGIVKLAKDFLKFCYTDESLAEFTKKSSVSKNLRYSLSDEQASALTNYGKSMWNLKNGGLVVTPISDNVIFIKNPTVFDMTDTKIWKIAETDYPAVAFTDSAIDAKTYFLKMKKDEAWLNSLKK